MGHVVVNHPCTTDEVLRIKKVLAKRTFAIAYFEKFEAAAKAKGMDTKAFLLSSISLISELLSDPAH